jgi:hypothetical protein
MKKGIIIAVIALSIIVTGLVMKFNVDDVAACSTWYTCDPPRCSQTVVYFDTWQECSQYARTRGFPGCACYGQDL